MIHLTVVHDFDGHKVGQKIADADKVKAVLGDHRRRYVVQTIVPDEVPSAPAIKSSSDAVATTGDTIHRDPAQTIIGARR